MSEESEKGPLDLVEILNEFQKIVPWSRCREILKWDTSHLYVPSAFTCGIAILDAASLLLLIPILSLLSGSRDFVDKLPSLSSYSPDQLLVGLATTLGVVGLAKAGLTYKLHTWNGQFYEQASEKLSNYLFHRYLRFGRAYFLETSQSKLWELLNKRHDLLSLFLAIQRLVLNSALLLTHLAILFFISWPLALLLGGLVPLFYLGLRLAAKRYEQKAAQAGQKVAELYPQAYQVFAAMDLHRSYCQEERAEREFTETNANIREASVANWNLAGSVERSREILSLLCLIVLLLATSRLVLHKPNLLMSYLVFFFIVKNSLPLMGTFQEVTLEFRAKLSSAREFLEVFTDSGKHLIQQGTRPFRSPNQGYTIRDLVFEYPNGVRVFQGLSFDIPAGQTTALVGPSGSGKSSLLQLLVRNFEFEGLIEVDGTSLRDFDLRSLRTQTALLDQSSILLRTTLRENLTFGLDADKGNQELLKVLSDVGLGGWLQLLPNGLETLIGDDGATVSAGQRQRLALARDLLRDTPVYLIDEPTSALDRVNEIEIQKLIRTVTKGRTTVLVTHKLEFLKTVDNIIVLKDGALMQKGTYDELSSRDGLFKTLSKDESEH